MSSEPVSSHKLYPFRVFLSYAHDDKELVAKIVVKAREELGLEPLWDSQINPGFPFPDEIKQLIAHSHLFMPIITANSKKSAWVHQEIGFAIALNIPILPLSIDGELAEVMLSTTQALVVRRDLSNLVEQLRNASLPQLIVPQPSRPYDPTTVVMSPIARSEHIIQYAEWVLGLRQYGKVRIQARFSSFAIPELSITDPIWEDFEGDVKRNDELREAQRQERKFLERHALLGGCKLIIDPRSPMRVEAARKPRLTALVDFMKRISPEKLEVAISPSGQDTNLLIVGDHFYAESLAEHPSGYRQTIFNSHPPTVLKRLQQFDQLFDEIQTHTHQTHTQIIAEIEGLLDNNGS